MSRLNLLSRSLLVVVLVFLPLPLFAISQLLISSPAADGVFILEGRLEGVSGIHARVSYDAGTLSNPRVALGTLMTGVLLAVNPVNPIHIAGITANGRGITSSGPIATITFDRIGVSPGRITALSADLIDAGQKRLDMAQPVITNPTQAVAATENRRSSTDSSSDSSNNSTRSEITAAAGRTHPLVVGGSVTLPTGEGTDDADGKGSPQPPQEQVTQEPTKNESLPASPVAEVSQATAQQAVGKSQARPAPSAKPVQSILERFHFFSGQKNARNLIDLFKRDTELSFSQIPPVALADGKATVKIVVHDVAGDKVPRFALASATLVSVARIGREWELVVTPRKGIVSGSVTLLLDGAVQEIPLTVAPRAELVLAKKEDPSPADFLPFLQELGQSSAPQYDLNNDGKRDYIDDYIFTANYLFKVEEKAKKKRTEPRKP